MFQFELPVGAVVTIKEKECRYLGNGCFASDRPVSVIEGITADGSEADSQWPELVLLHCMEAFPNPSNRRVVCTWLGGDVQAAIMRNPEPWFKAVGMSLRAPIDAAV